MLWLSFFCLSFAHILASSSVRKDVGVIILCPGNTLGADWADVLAGPTGVNT